MSCAPTACPPAEAPTPVTQPTWTVPAPFDCGRGRVYYNTPQTYVNTCEDSPTPPISVTTPAFTFSSEVSQEDADEQAMAAAQAEADAERLENPCTSSGGGFLVTEGGDFIVTEGGTNIIT